MALTPLDFPASPTVGQLYPDPPVTGQPTYQWDGAQWLSKFALGKEYVPLDGSVAMTGLLTLSGPPVNPLHATTKKYVDETSGYAKKNYIINGAMMVSQENGGTAGTATAYWPADQFFCGYNNAGVITVAQVASRTPAGSPNRVRITVTTADASVAAGDLLQIFQKIEGIRTADLMFGAATAKTITIQFGCRGPAGTYCVAVINGAANRSYVAEYVISAGEANTNVIKSVTIPGDVTGTWVTDSTGAGLDVRWFLMGGTTFQTAPNVWTAGTLLCTSNQFNFMGTINNTFELFDVSLTEGTVAPPFQVPDYASELLACKRYFYNGVPDVKGIGFNSTVAAQMMAAHPVAMRATPALTMTSNMIAQSGGAGLAGSKPITSVGINGTTLIRLGFDATCSGGGLTAGAVIITEATTGNLNVSARL